MMPADPAIESAALLHHLLLSLGADVASEWKSGTVRYTRGSRHFCVVKPMSRRVDVGFMKLGRARSKRILHARGKLPFVPYRVEVEAPGDIDSELRAWLKESYELAGE